MKKILVVEDESTTRKIIYRCVEGLGHCAIQSSSGRRALEVLLDNPDIALVITDIAMPDLDGRGLLAQMRADEHLRTIPVIVVSGVIGPKDIAAIMEEGASRFLPKPVELTTLKDYIVILLKT